VRAAWPPAILVPQLRQRQAHRAIMGRAFFAGGAFADDQGAGGAGVGALAGDVFEGGA